MTTLASPSIFISYSHNDDDWRERFATMLSPLIKGGKIGVFTDKDIKPGETWKLGINAALASATHALLLVSADFIASDFIMKQELPHILHAHRGTRVSWVLLRDCLWNETPLAEIQAAHDTSKPLDSLAPHERDQTIRSICQQLADDHVATRSQVDQRPIRLIDPHGFALERHFVGRNAERGRLRSWWDHETASIFLLHGFSGMGKSTLSWVWVIEDVITYSVPGMDHITSISSDTRPDAVVRYDFAASGATFNHFIEFAIRHLAPYAVTLPPPERIQALIDFLRSERVLLVFDNFERQLVAHAGAEMIRSNRPSLASLPESRCISEEAEVFLTHLGSQPMRSKVLITTQLRPLVLVGLQGVIELGLTGFTAEEARDLFHLEGVDITDAEYRNLSAEFGSDPLTLRIIVAVRRGREHTLARGRDDERRALLRSMLTGLSENERTLIEYISAFREVVDLDVLKKMNPVGSQQELTKALQGLSYRALVNVDWQRGLCDAHAVIRRVVYDNLMDPRGLHKEIADATRGLRLSDDVRLSDDARRRSSEDLYFAAELCFQLAKAGEVSDAIKLCRSELVPEPLDYHLGAYGLIRSLLSDLCLVPDEGTGADLTSAEAIWVLGELANSEAMTGHLDRAAELFRRQTDLMADCDDILDAGRTVVNRGVFQMLRGDLWSAHEALRQGRELGVDRGLNFDAALWYQEMGRLAIFRGQYKMAEQYLAIAERIFAKLERQQPLCVIEAYKSLMWLYRGEPGKALLCGDRSFLAAQERARSVSAVHRDFVRADWLIGWACDELRSRLESEETASLGDIAAIKLQYALKACDSSEVPELRAAVLVTYARHLMRTGRIKEASVEAERALRIANDQGYGLHKVNAHCALAEIAHKSGDTEGQKHHAEAAKRSAVGRKPKFWYRWGVDAAMRVQVAF
jgi:tetratricopeptide (TPR) repeat protein